MTICPIAIVAGCRKCPAVSMCPLKSVLGDYEKPVEKLAEQDSEKAQTSAKRDE
jgi:hypothetical protein